MRKCRILIDIDDTVGNFHNQFVLVSNKLLGKNFTYEESLKQRMVEKALNLSPEETRIVYDVVHGPGFAETLVPIDHAVETVLELNRVHDVFFVTSPPPIQKAPTWMVDRNKWLINIFGEELGSKVEYTDRKYLIRGDFLIEDTISYAEAWQIESRLTIPHATSILINRPYNESSNLLRFNNWKELPGLIEDVLRHVKC